MSTDLLKAQNQAPTLSAAETAALKVRMNSLLDSLSGLLQGNNDSLEDLQTAQAMAQEIKPYSDRISSLNNLLEPIDRIIDKQTQINDLQTEIAEEVAIVEGLSTATTAELASAMINEIRSELGAVKKDRKLQISQALPVEQAPTESTLSRTKPLIEMSIPERLETIFGDRFIGPQRLSKILDTVFSESELIKANLSLERLWETIFTRPTLQPHIEANQLSAIRQTFNDYALIYRIDQLPGAAESEPCNIEFLRRRFPSFFLSTSTNALWYQDLDFYLEPIDRPHWALLDRQYLNCTFKKPSIRLLMYARANDIPAEFVRQKSVIEDIYDRLLVATALGEHFFDNCNHITCNSYQFPNEVAKKLVYTFFKGNLIRISGKRSLPHWRPGKPQWPGVLPAIVF